MRYNFDRIRGPHQSQSANFEELVSQLLSVELGAEAVDGSGGDQGIDSFIRGDDDNIEVFQAKYFTERLSSSQRKQIKDSLQTASMNYSISRWVLCIAINPTPKERIWFESLAKHNIKLEWWGETKLRTLIEKYQYIADAFFPEEGLVSELKEFSKEVRKAIDAQKSSRWSREFDSDGDSVTNIYLNRAVSIGRTIAKDAVLLDRGKNISVGIDFSEIYMYMATQSELVVSSPIVEFCINKSPQAIFLPPGAAVELNVFINKCLHRERVEKDLEKLILRDNLITAFVQAFERNPNSKETLHVYQLVIERLNSNYFPPYFNQKKLKLAFESGALSLTRHAVLGIDDPELVTLLNILGKIRPHKRMANFVDAQNIVFVKKTLNCEDEGRIISSSPTIVAASQKMYGVNSPVRTSAEYAYLINAINQWQNSSCTDRENNSMAFVYNAGHLNETLNDLGLRGELLELGYENLSILLKAFHSFAPFYRALLRPIDEMIESGLNAVPKLFALNMNELYSFIKGEAKLIDGFRNWWDYMCQELRTIEAILLENGAEDIIEQFNEVAIGIQNE